MAWSSKKYHERNLHTAIPVFIAGACFMCAALPPRARALRRSVSVQHSVRGWAQCQ